MSSMHPPQQQPLGSAVADVGLQPNEQLFSLMLLPKDA